MLTSTIHDIDIIRTASRRIVRELGFMSNTLANTALSPSAVHTIIEIGNGNAQTAKELADILRLEKSSVSRLINRLLDKELVIAQTSTEDARLHRLSLTVHGQKLFDEIAGFARRQVQAALDTLPERDGKLIKTGLENYATALEQSGKNDPGTPTVSAPVDIRRGYTPTLLGRVTCMHAAYYSKNFGFKQYFESKVAGELAEFLSRREHSGNAIWSAHFERKIVGSITIDGEDLGKDKAHLRWFIVDVGLKGSGIGQKLISEAMAFVDQAGFHETHLWTFKGLDAARRLYERVGFSLAEEQKSRRWGDTVFEQRFVRKLQLRK
jgi:DNA-binding MarR family transcriptional regulator/ribosomal protein S18 acetylase RimI-like enzyme